jgi:NADP-dependent 3-hydroxy acid dehydrogenase YdfG
MKYIIVITGASSSFGARALRAMATAGHRVYASMRQTKGPNGRRRGGRSRGPRCC